MLTYVVLIGLYIRTTAPGRHSSHWPLLNASARSTTRSKSTIYTSLSCVHRALRLPRLILRPNPAVSPLQHTLFSSTYTVPLLQPISIHTDTNCPQGMA